MYRKKRFVRSDIVKISVQKPLRETVIQQYLLEQLLHASTLDQHISEVQPIISEDNFTVPSYGKLFIKLKERALTKGVFDINTFIKSLPPELASVADELYLKASSDEQGAANSLKHIAYEIKRYSLRTVLKNLLSHDPEAHEEKLKGLQAQLKELEKMSSTV